MCATAQWAIYSGVSHNSQSANPHSNMLVYKVLV